MKKTKIYMLIILQFFIIFTILHYGKIHYHKKKIEQEITTILNDSSFNEIDFYNNIYSKNFEILVIEVIKLVDEEEKNKDTINEIKLYFEESVINKISIDKLILEGNLKYNHKKILVIENNLIEIIIELINEKHKIKA